MTQDSVTVAIYASHGAAEQAVRTLQKSGFDLGDISIVGRDYFTEEHAVGFFNLGERTRFFGKLGAFWGTLGGILFGAFVIFIPILGHIIILGPLAATIVTGLEGAAVGGAAGALVGALTGLGVPKDTAIRYETAIRAGEFLVAVQGGEDDVARALAVLGPTHPSTMASHAALPLPAEA
jgi:uncharacterized membrane protein